MKLIRLSFIMKHTSIIPGLVLLVLFIESHADITDKLQIGITKRAAKCVRKAKTGDFLHVHYKGHVKGETTEFDNSYKRKESSAFTLGSGNMIQGWDKGLVGMCEGEKRKLIIPSYLAYGEEGVPPNIPGNATVIFEIELLKIERFKHKVFRHEQFDEL